MLERLALFERIVLLGVARAELAAADDELEDVHQSRIVLACLGERNKLVRQARHEGRLAQIFLDELVVDLVREHERILDVVKLEIGLLLASHGFGFVKLSLKRKLEPVLAHEFLDKILIGYAAVRRIEVDDLLALAVLDLTGTDDRVAQVRNQAFDDRFHRSAVAIRLIDFKNRELGIVTAVDTLVAEILAELEDLVHSADEQTLQVKLRGDAQHHLLVERVEMRFKGLRRRASGLRLQNRGFDFMKAFRPQILARLLKDIRTHEEAIAGLVVGHEIDVAAAVALLLVGKTVELLRRLLKSLGEHRPLFDHERFLTLLRRKKRSFRTDYVAEIQKLERGEHLLGKFIALEDELELVRAVVQSGEVHLAHAADHHQPSG